MVNFDSNTHLPLAVRKKKELNYNNLPRSLEKCYKPSHIFIYYTFQIKFSSKITSK